MKFFYLIGALMLTVVILIISFQNFSAMCTELVVFFTPVSTQTPPTILIFVIALIGMIAGAFYFGFFQSLLRGDGSAEEESPEEEGF